MSKDETILHADDCDCQECLDKWSTLMSDVVFPSSNEVTIKTNYEWINVKDKMPEENKRVIISCNEGVCAGKYSRQSWQCDPIGSYASDGCVYYVTHWMPLPLTPKVEKENVEE